MLSYHYSLRAPGTRTEPQLLAFLKQVEVRAKALGFSPTLVLDAPFDTPERKAFAQRITSGLRLEDRRLIGAEPRTGQLWDHDPLHGRCRVMPQRGVFLIVTDERQCEVVFGFLRYPLAVVDCPGKEILPTGVGDHWGFRNFVDSPDSRYRQIIGEFAQSGYLENEEDEYRPRLSEQQESNSPLVKKS